MSDNIWNPGQRVVLKGSENWGIGQVQSSIGDRVTVNFEQAGKQVIRTNRATLVAVSVEDDVETAEQPCCDE